MASVYYYYAYMEGGICIDVERTRTAKTDLTNYIEITAAQYEASYNEENSEDNILGKSWNGSEWYVDDTLYYAIINEKFICVNLATLAEETNDKAFVKITREEYESMSILGKKYDETAGQFYEVTFPQRADADTTNISVNGQDISLQEVIQSLQEAVNDKSNSIDFETIVKMLKASDGANSGFDADYLDGYDSSHFASKDDLTSYAKTEQLTDLVNKSEIANLASKNDLNDLATKVELTNYAAKSDLDSYAKTDALTNYATKSDLSNFATVSALNSVSAQNANLASQVSNCNSQISNLAVRPSINVEFQKRFKSDTYRGAVEFNLGYRPYAVLVVPEDGKMYDNEREVARGGLFVDNGADTSRLGCAITDTGFTVYSYEEDGIALASGAKSFLIFKK